MQAFSSPPFYTRYGFSRTGDADAPLEIEPYMEICVGGALRSAVVASAVDLVGGLVTRAIAGTDATFTSDLSLRIVAPGIPRSILVHGAMLRAGHRLVTTGVRLEADEMLYAYGETTFSRIPREGESAPDVASLSTPETIGHNPLERPLADEVGIEIVDAAAGAVRLPLRPALRNPEGVMQGALVALLAETSALALAEHSLGAPQIVTELDLRYLAGASVGPIEGLAAWIGAPEARVLRVELRDAGRDDRLTTTCLARVDAAIV